MKSHRMMAGLRVVAGAAVLLFAGAASAQTLGAVISATIKKNEANEASQKRVEAIVAQTDKLESSSRQVLKETDGLNVYIELLENQVRNQEIEMEILANSAEKVSVIERQILPQMKKMIDALESFIALDMPFLQEERAQRVARLNSDLQRADVSVAEKFRSVVEAYKIEADYGKEIETYKDTIEDSDGTYAVDILRIGRIGLYWQNADASVTRGWDHQQKRWIDLGDEYRSAVRNGIQVAGKKKAPEMLLLPLPGPEAT